MGFIYKEIVLQLIIFGTKETNKAEKIKVQTIWLSIQTQLNKVFFLSLQYME